MSTKGQADIAARREEIVSHIRVVMRRRGPDSTIALDVLASVLSAKFRALRKDMLRFLEKSLTSAERIELGILSSNRLPEVLDIDSLPEPVEPEPKPEVPDRGTFTVEWITLDELRIIRDESRAQLRMESKLLYDSLKPVRDAERATRAALAVLGREASRLHREEERQRAARAKQEERNNKAAEKEAARLKKKSERIALREARAKRKGAKKTKAAPPAKPLPVSVAAQKPLVPVVYRAPAGARYVAPKPRPRPDMATAVVRAARVLKGVTDVNNENVAHRAAMICGIEKDKVLAYVSKLPPERRAELCFSETVAKPKNAKLRPLSPTIVVKGLI